LPNKPVEMRTPMKNTKNLWIFRAFAWEKK